MNIFLHEIKQGLRSLCVWTVTISSFMMICILIFPDMTGEAANIGDMFSSMGIFAQAFSLDVIDFGSLKGYYAIECGNIIGIGGALFASLLGIAALAKEEGAHTAEFLFSHPVTRNRVITEKLLSVFAQIIFLNVVVFVACIFSMLFIGESIFWKELVLLHVAYFLSQLVIASICFLFSSLLNSSNFGLGLGFALILYFLNLIAKITESASFLKYLTPFSFAESSDIIQYSKINVQYFIPSCIIAIISLALSYFIYNKKDLRT